jgi:hypothetical protein
MILGIQQRKYLRARARSRGPEVGLDGTGPPKIIDFGVDHALIANSVGSPEGPIFIIFFQMNQL